MVEITGIDKLFSCVVRKRFGLYRKFGTSQFAHSHFGDDDIYFVRTGFGTAELGFDIFSDIIILTGVYRTESTSKGLRCYREPYYITRNPRTVAQQAWRKVFGDAVRAWRDLTSEEKELYNKRAKRKNMSGYNLFISDYLKSH